MIYGGQYDEKFSSHNKIYRKADSACHTAALYYHMAVLLLSDIQIYTDEKSRQVRYAAQCGENDGERNKAGQDAGFYAAPLNGAAFYMSLRMAPRAASIHFERSSGLMPRLGAICPSSGGQGRYPSKFI